MSRQLNKGTMDSLLLLPLATAESLFRTSNGAACSTATVADVGIATRTSASLFVIGGLERATDVTRPLFENSGDNVVFGRSSDIG
jgi:hypothetical protein